MNRRDCLVHDDPQGMVEALHNTAFAKDGEVWLRGCGMDDGDMRLTAFCAGECAENCDANYRDIPADEFGEHMDCECPVALLYTIAVGAAELRSKLQVYEKAGTLAEVEAIIQEKRDIENLQPLTLDELKQMDGEPVYMVNSESSSKNGWCIVGKYYDGSMALFCPDNTWYTYAVKTGYIQAYRHKPREEKTI